MFSFKISQQPLKKLRLKPYGLGILSLALVQITSLTSSIRKGSLREHISSTESFLKWTPSNNGLLFTSSFNRISKCLLTKFLTSSTYSIHRDIVLKLTILFLLNFDFIALYNNFELESSSLIHLCLDFCLNILSLRAMVCHTFDEACIRFSSI